MSFLPSYVEQARREIVNAPFGGKTVIAQRWSEVMNISVQQVYRLINDAGGKRNRKGIPFKPELREWTETINIIKKRPPEEAGELSTEDALAVAVKAELIPEEAGNIPVGTFNLIARKMGFNKRQRRISRFQAERPNQAHHFDASTSKFFYIAKALGSDDYLLKMYRPAKHYKNKPIPVDALRPWLYGLADDHSGRHVARYVAARGENAVDSMQFLTWAWEDMGLCDKLLADQGMLKKNLASAEFIDRLGIELPQMDPYNKEGHGKIERPWRTLWKKFETTFFAVDNWQKFEIPMSEINSRLMNYINDKYNEMPHRFEKEITRLQAWKRINLYGGMVSIPENALATVAKRRRRKVGADGILNYEGGIYEVKGLHDAWVHVFEGVFEDRLIVQEIETGQKYEVREFKPLGLDEYKAHTETPHQKLIKETGNIKVPHSAMLYAEKKSSDENVLEIPIRTKEDREVSNPLDVNVFSSLQAAMKEFYEIVGTFVPADQREVIEKTIQENQLNKNFVTDLALEIRAAIEQRRLAVNG